MYNKNVLILGGAGFIGSNLVEKFINYRYDVTVIDGLLEKTGGCLQNISKILNKITFIEKKIEEVQNLSKIISKHDIIIDSMAWTSHLSALKNPMYDLELNVKSHLYFLEEINKSRSKANKVIYLGSRGQYGNPKVDVINETIPMIPEDIQGIHKLTAENYYRIYSKIHGLNIISLRIPNCFGENQPYECNDIGLVGSFIRDSLKNKTIEIYGKGRKRNLIYIRDLTDIVYRLSNTSFSGFSSFNIAGYETTIKDLVTAIITITNKGNFILKKIPEEIKNIDTGFARYDDTKLKSILENFNLTKFEKAIENTINYCIQRIKNN